MHNKYAWGVSRQTKTEYCWSEKPKLKCWVDGILLIELFKRNHGILCIRQTNASLHFSVKNKRKTVHGLLMWSIEISGTTFFFRYLKICVAKMFSSANRMVGICLMSTPEILCDWHFLFSALRSPLSISLKSHMCNISVRKFAFDMALSQPFIFYVQFSPEWMWTIAT